jgi:hypothetical protein
MRRAAAIALALMLAGCGNANTPVDPLTGAPEPSYKVPNQPQDVVFVPVLRYGRDDSTAKMEDVLGYTLTLDQCKAALRKLAAQPKTGQFAGYKPRERACYEVNRNGGQKKIAVT